MDFPRFIELPVETKIQIINKCSPIPYVRLRQTCHFVDEFCEHNRKWLRIYCCFSYRNIEFLHDRKTKLDYISLRGNWHPTKFQTIPENTTKLNKALSGLAFTRVEFNSYYKPKSYYASLKYFIEAVPDFKVNFLVLTFMKLKPVEWIMASKWKIGGVKVDCQKENRKVLKIERIRKMDPLYCNWNKEDKLFPEEDIVQLARGKKRVLLHPQFLSTLSSLNVIMAIAQNWKRDGQYPTWFNMCWKYERNYMGTSILEAELSGLYSEIMDLEACHLGSFLRTNESVYEIYDIWIRKDGAKWQFVRFKRSDYQHGTGGIGDYGIGANFTLETTESTTAFIKEITSVLRWIYSVPADVPSLYQACLTENLEKIKEAFLNIIPRQQQ